MYIDSSLALTNDNIMSDEAEAGASSVPAPLVVEYDPITGVPAEYNEYLPPDSQEFKKWKASQEGPEGLEKLKITDSKGVEIEKKLPGGKVKKKQKPAILIETNVRNKKKCVTTVTGLDLFTVKLNEASKVFGKKFASGASVTKASDGKEQIDIQGDFLSQVAELIIKNYGKSNNITKGDVYFINEVGCWLAGLRRAWQALMGCSCAAAYMCCVLNELPTKQLPEQACEGFPDVPPAGLVVAHMLAAARAASVHSAGHSTLPLEGGTASLTQ